MSEIVTLESIRDCLRAGLPCALATCSPDGMPHIGYVSQVRYLDKERVATSRQFFNRVLPSPASQALITRPTTGEQFRLDLEYLHTTTEGDEFEAMRATFDAVASQTGTGPAHRLRGLDVHRVVGCARVPGHARTAATDDLLEPLEQLSRRLERATTYEETTYEVLDALDDVFGFRHAVLLALDTPTGRLFATAGSGDTRTAVGAEVEIGTGLIGTAASRRRLIVVANLDRSRAMADAINGGSAARPGLEIPLVGLAGARSAAAVPLIVGEDILGVLYLESLQPSAFSGPVEGLLRILGTQTAAALAARGAPTAEEDPQSPPAAGPASISHGPAMQLVYYQADDTVLCDSAYIVKGAPGRILWSMVKAHVTAGRTQFSNRELRLDESLGLPAGNDNLEARLLVLRRRLADMDCGVVLERVGRGRLDLRVQRPAVLTVVPTTGPMRSAHLSDF